MFFFNIEILDYYKIDTLAVSAAFLREILLYILDYKMLHFWRCGFSCDCLRATRGRVLPKVWNLFAAVFLFVLQVA